MGGAPHASEIPYVFNTQDVRRDAIDTGKDAAVAQVTHRLWVNFAKTGSPSSPGAPIWQAATADDNRVYLIGSDGSAQVVDPRQKSVDFVQRRAEK